uniref:Uncharacterized protein n=1 Tax=Arundo donax TaxID=35708 RepID=A0A0A9A2C4_ARUDO
MEAAATEHTDDLADVSRRQCCPRPPAWSCNSSSKKNKCHSISRTSSLGLNSLY